jgi:curved DNA-binding protein CbpA
LIPSLLFQTCAAMPSDSFKDYYADLGLELGASAGAIRKAFQDLAKKHHPDKSGIADATVFRRVREAFEKLSDPEYRAQYDRSYWRRKFQTDDIPTKEENRSAGEENFGDTRNTSHGAETQEARSASPPPVKPQRKPNEPSWQYFLGKAYTTWQKEEAAYRVRHPEVYERYVGLFASYLIYLLKPFLVRSAVAHLLPSLEVWHMAWSF